MEQNLRRRPSPAAAPARMAAVPVRQIGKSLAQRRGYQRQDLYAVAEIAHHYLFSGGTEIALAILEGLTAVAPEEAYFALARGLTHDHMGDTTEAERWYAKAGELDPSDAHSDINRAELRLEKKDFARARALLKSGANKARARRDSALERKALALLEHIHGR
jgi:Flp pilus assembly protein TadD